MSRSTLDNIVALWFVAVLIVISILFGMEGEVPDWAGYLAIGLSAFAVFSVIPLHYLKKRFRP